MKKYFTSTILIIFLTQLIFSQENSNWRGPERNGVYPGKNLLKKWPDMGPELLWRFDNLGIGYSTVAISTNNIITAGTIDSISYIYSFDRSGKLLWKTKMGPEWSEGDFPGIRATPVIYKSYGYIMNGLGVLFCFDSDTGEIHWSENIFKKYIGKWGLHGVSESILVDGNMLYCTPGGFEANVIALNRFTGDLIWECTGNGAKSAFSSLNLIERGSNKFLIGTNSKSIFAIQAYNGKMAWNYEFELELACNTPIYHDGILINLNTQKGVAFKISEDGFSADILWQNGNLGVFLGDAVIIGENLYAYSSINCRLYVIDLYTGEEICYEQFPEKHQGAAVISADNMIYCYTVRGNISLFDPSNDKLELISSFDLPINSNDHCSYPVINNGNLYIRNNNSLFVYKISDG